jgi:hypothetical protein
VTAFLPYLPQLLFGFGVMAALLAALYPVRERLIAWWDTLIEDPDSHTPSSKRLAGIVAYATGCASVLAYPDHPGTAAVAYAAGAAALGISQNPGGSTALAGGLAALRGVPAPPAPATTSTSITSTSTTSTPTDGGTP